MNIWICDDEPDVTAFISRKVKLRYPDAHIQQFHTAASLLHAESCFDVLFLDIEIPEINGIAVAEKLRARHVLSPIIFVTAHDKYVFQAFDVQAFHYLTKPFETKKFYEVLQNAYEQRQAKQMDSPYLLIKSGFTLQKVFHHEIYYLEVFGRKITVHTEQNTYHFNGKLHVIETTLGEAFFRVHRSFLVHFKFIKNYDKQQITLENGAVLSLSQKKYTAFVQAYLHYIKHKGYVHT